MGTLTVMEHLTLDGVMQAPGDPDEDTTGGFAHGGWHQPYVDDDFMAIVADGSAPEPAAYLFGRRTYDIMARFWPDMPDDVPFAATLNHTPKYVVSTTQTKPLAWQNSTLLSSEAGDAVAALKRDVEGTIAVMGSAQLVRTLMAHDLVDEYLVMLDPLLLGTGRRLFDGLDKRTPLRLIDTKTTGAGVIFATYRPDRS